MYKRIMSLLLVFLLAFVIVGCKKDKDAIDDILEDPNVGDEQIVDEEEVEEYFYVLYLKHKNLPYIFSDSYSVKSDDPRLQGKSLEEFVVEELINQEDVGDLVNPIPDETKVLSVERDGNTVIVDLSQEFIDNMKGRKADVEATVAIIVNSLTTLPGNDYVRILVEGNSVTNLRGADISQDFEFVSDFHGEK